MAFQLGQQIYALPIAAIAQIVEMVAITPIPQVNHIVAGIINVRGASVPVVNLRRHLGLPEARLRLDTHIVLAQTEGHMIGLIVDKVLDVLNLPDSQIEHPDEVLPEELGTAPMLQGLALTQALAVVPGASEEALTSSGFNAQQVIS